MRADLHFLLICQFTGGAEQRIFALGRQIHPMYPVFTRISSMLGKVKHYIRSRFRDPVSWLAISMVGVWAISAVSGLAPFQMLNLVSFALAAIEWWVLASWWRKSRRTPADGIQLTPALERWKVAVILLIAATTLVLDLWVGALMSGGLGFGLSVLGISSLITLWYVWSRPIAVTSRGLIVGIDSLEWSQVRRVTWSDAEGMSIDFVEPNYFYGTKITLTIPAAQAAAVDALLPKTLERNGVANVVRDR